MSLSSVPEVRLDGSGVVFKYLVLDLQRGEESRTVVRAINYRCYQPQPEGALLDWVAEELRHAGLEVEIQVRGGGSLSWNRYSESITLFGSSPLYGVEPNRSDTARMMEGAFPEHQVHWEVPENETAAASAGQ